MSSADIFYGLGKGAYWLFENTLEPTGEMFWKVMLVFGFILPDEKKGLQIDVTMFKTSREFAIGAGVVLAILIGLYAYFW